MESEFHYHSITNIKIVILHFTQLYDLKVVTKPGPMSNQIVVQFEDVQVDDSLENPSETDLRALNLPFIIEINNDGSFAGMVSSPEETKFSLMQKENVAALLVYNQTEISQGFKQSLGSNSTVFLENETPLGHCSSEYATRDIGASYILDVQTTREGCNGTVSGGMLDNFGVHIAHDSEFHYSFQMRKITSQFERADVSLKLNVNTFPKAKVSVKQHVDFLRFRDISNNISLANIVTRHPKKEKL